MREGGNKGGREGTRREQGREGGNEGGRKESREGGREQGREKGESGRKEEVAKGLLFMFILHQTARVVLHPGVNMDTRPHLLPGDKHPASFGWIRVQPCGCKGEMPGLKAASLRTMDSSNQMWGGGGLHIEKRMYVNFWVFVASFSGSSPAFCRSLYSM